MEHVPHERRLNILEEHFVAMRAWVDYVRRVGGDHHGWRSDALQFGGWLALDGPAGERTGGTDEGHIADLYFWKSASIAAGAARALGPHEVSEEYQSLADSLAQRTSREYFSATGRCVVNTRTAYALALVFGFGSREFMRLRLTVPLGCEAELSLPFAPESAYEELGGHTLKAGTYEVYYQTMGPLYGMPGVDTSLAELMATPDTEAVVKHSCSHPEFLVGDPAKASRSIRDMASTLGRGGAPLGDDRLAALDEALRALWE